MSNQKLKTIVAAVKCSFYDQSLLSEKVAEAVNLSGGWPKSVRHGSHVLLKPNLLTVRTPEEAVTTHPEFVRAVIRVLRQNSINEITIGDSPAGNYSWEELWKLTGMRKIADEENVKLLPFENVTRIDISKIGTLPILKELKSFDAVISLPKLKTHMLTKITGAVKNSYGLVIGRAKSAFHGKYPSPQKMAGFLAAIYGQLKPDFVIMDAVECMEGNGPANGTPHRLGLILAGEDAVAVDVCACQAYGYNATDIPMLVETGKLEAGVIDPELIQKNGDGWSLISAQKAKKSKADFLNFIPESVFHMATFFLRYRPYINPDICVKCGVCQNVCSQKAIKLPPKKTAVNSQKCILCMCCLEACSSHAIELQSAGQYFLRSFRKTIRRLILFLSHIITSDKK